MSYLVFASFEAADAAEQQVRSNIEAWFVENMPALYDSEARGLIGVKLGMLALESVRTTGWHTPTEYVEGWAMPVPRAADFSTFPMTLEQFLAGVTGGVPYDSVTALPEVDDEAV